MAILSSILLIRAARHWVHHRRQDHRRGWGDLSRLRSKGAFAMFTGTAPQGDSCLEVRLGVELGHARLVPGMGDHEVLVGAVDQLRALIRDRIAETRSAFRQDQGSSAEPGREPVRVVLDVFTAQAIWFSMVLRGDRSIRAGVGALARPRRHQGLHGQAAFRRQVSEGGDEMPQEATVQRGLQAVDGRRQRGEDGRLTT
jgi:hypothetical protein